MSAIVKAGKPSYGTLLPPANCRITGLYVGENIAAGDACRISASDGLVYRANGAAVGLLNQVDGYAPKDYYVAQKEPITLMDGLTWSYGTGLTPGNVYLSGSVLGGLDTAPSTGGTAPCGRIIDDQRIKLWSTRY
jgi:hypothetical protein